MEKEMFCKIGARCKRIKYVKKENMSDLDHIRCCIENLAKSDSNLNDWLKGGVIEQKHPTKNIFFEIEVSDEVPDGAELSLVKLIPEAPVAVPVLSPSDVEEVHKQVTTGEMVVFDVPDNTDMATLLEKALPGSSEDSTIQKDTSTQGAVKRIKATEVSSVPENIQLPKLPNTLIQKIQEIGAARCQSNMIAFYADHLNELTNNAPKPTDYFNYAQAIVSAFPALSGGQHNNGIVKQALSIRIRNQRSFNKRKKSGMFENAHKTNSMAAVQPKDHSELSTSLLDEEEAEKELKRCRDLNDCAHIRYLMKETHTKRREWIKGEATSITHIIDTYPHLKQASLVLHEFQLLRDVNLDSLKVKAREMLDDLQRVALITGDTDEERDVKSLIWLFGQLCQKRFLSGGVKELFIVKEAMTSLQDLDTVPTNSPRLVFYLSEGRICATFIVADGTLKLQMDNFTVEATIVCLLSTYYVYDTTYPVAYRATLSYLDHKILGSSIPDKQPTIAKFLRLMAAIDESTIES